MKAIKTNRITSYVTDIRLYDKSDRIIDRFSSTSTISPESAEQHCYKKALSFVNRLHFYLVSDTPRVDSVWGEKECIDKHKITHEEINDIVQKLKKLIISSEVKDNQIQL